MSSRGTTKTVKGSSRRSTSKDNSVAKTIKGKVSDVKVKDKSIKTTKGTTKTIKAIKATEKDTVDTVGTTTTVGDSTLTDTEYRPPLMEHLETLESNRREVHETLRSWTKSLKESLKTLKKVRKACLRETNDPTNPTNLHLEQLETNLSELLDRDNEKTMLTNYRTFNDQYQKFVRPYTRESKKIQDKKDKRKRTSSGGIQKPVHITPEFAKFLGVKKDTMMSRTDGTVAIVAYIKENNLPYAKNKRIINPDDKLSALLKLPKEKDFELTYFNLQKFMKDLYVADDTTTTTTSN